MTLNLRAMGFCGVDESIDPKLLQLLSNHYPWVEWGILFRPDLEGAPRYPRPNWLQKLSDSAKSSGSRMNLAGHLCGSRCQEILQGDFRFVSSLENLGFKRIQINATAANNVLIKLTDIDEYVNNIRKCMLAVPTVEWIVQCNEETRCIVYQPLLADPPHNMSILFDASCGLGVPMTEFSN
jgi:hypothetical protein